MLRTVCALLLLLLASAPRAVADPAADAIAALPVEIAHLRVGGTWKAGDASGYFRLVVARAQPGSDAARLFVQWVESDGTAEAVAATTEIVEIAEKRVRLTDLRMETVEEGTNLFVETAEIDTGIVDDLMVLLASPGLYEATPLGN